MPRSTNTVQRIDAFHQTARGKIFFGLVELAIAYALVSRAIDTGSLWQYGFSLVFFIGGLNNIVRALSSKKSNGKVKKR